MNVDAVACARSVFRRAAGMAALRSKFRCHLKAPNGEIIAASQGYDTKAGAEKRIESVTTNASSATVVDLTERLPAQLEPLL